MEKNEVGFLAIKVLERMDEIIREKYYPENLFSTDDSSYEDDEEVLDDERTGDKLGLIYGSYDDLLEGVTNLLTKELVISNPRNLKVQIEELKDWSERQRSVLNSIHRSGFKKVINSGESLKSWLEAELVHFMKMIDNLEASEVQKERDIVVDGEGEEGICPFCKSDDLDWGSSYPRDASYVYEWRCCECGAKGEEVMDLVFAGHYNLSKND